MKLKFLSNSSGLTLVELLIALGITAVVGTLLLYIFAQNNGLFLEQSAKVSQGLSLDNAITEINNSVRSAAFVSATCPVSTCPSTYTSDSHSIVLAIPSIDSAGEMISNVYDFVVVTSDQTNPKILRKFVFPDSQSQNKAENRVLSTSLNEVKFHYLNQNNTPVAVNVASKINYYINLNQTIGFTSHQSSASSQINLRNF